jgi:hypothetical protein
LVVVAGDAARESIVAGRTEGDTVPVVVTGIAIRNYVVV